MIKTLRLKRPLSERANRRIGRIKWAGGFLVILVGSLSLIVPSSSSSSCTRNERGLIKGTTEATTTTTSAAVVSGASSSTTESTEQQQLAAAVVDSQLLFWSLHDCAIDAALQFLGPIDIFLRGGNTLAFADPDTVVVEEEDQEEKQEWTTTTTTASATISSSGTMHTNISVEDQINLQQQQQQDESSFQERHHVAKALFAKGRAIVKEKVFPFPTPANEKHENNESNPITTSTVLFNGSSSSSPSSSLEVRGGGPGGWRGSNSNKYVFSLYQKGDGSDTDPDGLPKRYVEMHSGSKHARELSQKSLEATLEWRREHNIDSVLREPHPKYDICKQVFPHYYLGRGASDGRPIFLQRPALLNLKLAEKNKLTKEELLMHYVYVNEYLWQIVEGSSPLQMMTSVIDLSGLDLSMLRQRDNIAFLKLFVATMDSHYPQRAHKTLLLNAPKWFSTLYKLLSPFLRETTKSKIEIHQRGKKQDEAIRKYLGKQAVDLLPPSFFSKPAVGGNHSKKATTRKSSMMAFWRRKKEPQPQEDEEEDDATTEDSSGDSSEDSSEDDEDEDDTKNGKKTKKKKLSREEEKERLRNEAPPVVSDLEEGLREFTLQRLKDAGKKMQPVVV